jgi:hypothetical protein
VWSVLGVQSRARRTVAGFANGVDDGKADGADERADAAAEPVGPGGGVVGPPPEQPATRDAAKAATARARRIFTLTRFLLRLRNAERRPGNRDGVESAGLLPSLVRTRSGSAGLWSSHTLSAHALPGGDSSVVG